jgi:hypothetical protein
MMPFTEVFEQKAAAAAALLPPDVGKLLAERRGGKYQVDLQDLCCDGCFVLCRALYSGFDSLNRSLAFIYLPPRI